MIDANSYYIDEYDRLQTEQHKNDCWRADAKRHAFEIAEHFKVHPDLYDYFAEWYAEYMIQNPDMFETTCIYLDSDYIVDWWEAESYLYDDFDSPYMEIKK